MKANPQLTMEPPVVAVMEDKSETRCNKDVRRLAATLDLPEAYGDRVMIVIKQAWHHGFAYSFTESEGVK